MMKGRLAASIFVPSFGKDAQERIVDGPLKSASVKDRLVVEHENGGLSFAMMLKRDVAALAHHVPEQNRALTSVDPIVQRLAADRRLCAHLLPLIADPRERGRGRPLRCTARG